jgi:hypothetical protein
MVTRIGKQSCFRTEIEAAAFRSYRANRLRAKGRLARNRPLSYQILVNSIPTDHKLGCKAHRRCMARERVAAVEALAHRSRSTLTGQCMLAAPGTLIDILHSMPVLCTPDPAEHNPAHKRVVHNGVRSRRLAPHKVGSRFRSQHERGETRYRRLPAPRRQIAARQPKLAMTTERQVQG